MLKQRQPLPIHYNTQLIKKIFFDILTARYLGFDCQSKINGLYYDVEFCNVYWECRQGTAKKYECPSDYAFNHMTRMCDLRSKVDCSRREQPTSKVSQTSSKPSTSNYPSTTTKSLTNENNTTVISSMTITTITTTSASNYSTILNFTTIDFQPDNNSTNSSNKIICKILHPVLSFLISVYFY